MELVAFDSNRTTITAALQSIRDYVHLSALVTPPTWLDDRPSPPDPRNLLPFPSGTLDPATNKVLPPTPALFNINAIDFDYFPNPSPPQRWLEFLHQLWGDDIESVGLLQEWMSYCLVADTSQQKMLMIVGPKRSGKGTIGRVTNRLGGAGNVVGPTTSSLAGSFGLQPPIGKSLAIISDDIGVVVERLLCISGEDALTVDRKFLGGMAMKLPTRFMFLTNELPRMNDASAALAGRFAILRLTRSFYGQEDTTLSQQLMSELPGILVWAIEGLKRLRAVVASSSPCRCRMRCGTWRIWLPPCWLLCGTVARSVPAAARGSRMGTKHGRHGARAMAATPSPIGRSSGGIWRRPLPVSSAAETASKAALRGHRAAGRRHGVMHADAPCSRSQAPGGSCTAMTGCLYRACTAMNQGPRYTNTQHLQGSEGLVPRCAAHFPYLLHAYAGAHAGVDWDAMGCVAVHRGTHAVQTPPRPFPPHAVKGGIDEYAISHCGVRCERSAETGGRAAW